MSMSTFRERGQLFSVHVYASVHSYIRVYICVRWHLMFARNVPIARRRIS